MFGLLCVCFVLFYFVLRCCVCLFGLVFVCLMCVVVCLVCVVFCSVLFWCWFVSVCVVVLFLQCLNLFFMFVCDSASFSNVFVWVCFVCVFGLLCVCLLCVVLLSCFVLFRFVSFCFVL